MGSDAAAEEDGAQLAETAKELVFAASPAKKKQEDVVEVDSPDPPGWGVNFSPSQLSPSEINFHGGRRRVRMLYGQDPDVATRTLSCSRRRARCTGFSTRSTSGPPTRRP